MLLHLGGLQVKLLQSIFETEMKDHSLEAHLRLMDVEVRHRHQAAIMKRPHCSLSRALPDPQLHVRAHALAQLQDESRGLLQPPRSSE